MKKILNILILLNCVSFGFAQSTPKKSIEKSPKVSVDIHLNAQLNKMQSCIDSLNIAYQKDIELIKKEQNEKYMYYYDQLDSDLDRFLIYMSIFWGIIGIVLGLVLPLLLNNKAEKRILDDINNIKNIVDQQLRAQNRIMASRLREQYKEIDTKIQNQNNIFGKRFAQHKAYIDRVSSEVENYEKQSKINSLFTQAQNIVQTAPEEAITLYTQILNIDNNNEMAFLWRGIAYEIMKKDAEALNDLNKTLEINPRNVRAYNNIGNVYANNKQFDLSIQNYMKGLEIDPKNANIYSNLSTLEISRKQFSEAITYIENALAIDPNNKDSHMKKRYIYIRLLKDETNDSLKEKYTKIIKQETEIINKLDSKS